MLHIQDITYLHPNKDLLFHNITLSIHAHEKIALIGNNGTGKSTLLQIINKELLPHSGAILGHANIYRVPQLYHRYDTMTIAQALGIDQKIKALTNIQHGSVYEEDFEIIGDDWLIEERYYQCINKWQLGKIPPYTEMKNLSGGQKTKIFLAGIELFDPALILMDEPTNHLDYNSRQQLYDLIQQTTKTLLIVSHDRTLLNLLTKTIEVTSEGLISYAGNYDYYVAQKTMERDALNHDLQDAQKELRKAKQKERESHERQNKLDARGQKKQEKAGVSRIMMNTLRNKAENSSSKLKSVHEDKTANLKDNINSIQSHIKAIEKIRFDFTNSNLHNGKVLVEMEKVNIMVNEKLLWKNDVSLKIRSGERLLIQGNNGSGKTSLIKIILGSLQASKGVCHTLFHNIAYIDQDYTILRQQDTIAAFAQRYNTSNLTLSEINTRLKHFLFQPQDWTKKVEVLSGGERLRLLLCCLTLQQYPPDMLILDEPTNNLDLENIAILTHAIQSYKGTLLIISHDKTFVDEIQLNDTLELENKE